MMRGFATTVVILLCFVRSPAQEFQRAESPDTSGSSATTISRAALYVTGYVGVSMYVLGKTWYKDRRRVSFHFYDDTRAFLQVDKFGHAFGAYVYSYVGFHSLLNLGFNRREALWLGAPLGAVLQFPIEIMDGLHEGYGFSWGDVAANTAGSMLVLGQELLFDEQIVTFKFSYSPSGYAEKANGMFGTGAMERVLKDYNGQTYWLSVPLVKLAPGSGLPGWLSVAVGYGAGGMYGEFSNESSYRGVALPSAVRHRQFLLSLDVDWNRIETDSGLLRAILRAMTFVKLPFPALEYNSRGEFTLHWMYY